MGVIKDRKLATKRLRQLIASPSQVLLIHYSQLKAFDDEYNEISPMISAIVVKSLDGNIEKHFAIHLEADKANFSIEGIENSYRDLELRILKNFNEFVKRHSNALWVHWDMKNIHFGFDAIKHRFEKILEGLNGLNERYEEIPFNNKINLCQILKEMYGEKFADNPDKLASMMKVNNEEILNNSYLILETEAEEFERKNFTAVLGSLDCKVDFISKALKLLSEKKLKVCNKNGYAVFIDFISHPIFNLIGWLATILALALTLESIFK